jgi:type II secretory pathway pseudopilin PulG
MKRRTRRGFTLIELVASAVLTAMLTVTLMSVVWSVVRESAQLAKSQIWRAPVTQLVAQMRRDFQNARGMAVTPAGVRLHGFLDQDRRSGDPTLLAGSVHYQTALVADRRVLVRRAAGVTGSQDAPVWIGIGGLQIEPLEFTEAEDALLGDPMAGGLPPVPGSFRVTMTGDQGHVLWREVIHHHGY